MPSYDLPDDVFSEGDVKPMRPQKKRPVNGTTKKRSAMEVRVHRLSPWLAGAKSEHHAYAIPQAPQRQVMSFQC